jgi:predicted short-subunit dehydrogenase-like oxidoreductase (DUF2520 family)
MKYRIAIIGAGNVAWHLAPALENAGHTITEIYSRDIKDAEKLTNQVYVAESKDDLDFSESEAQIFILAISDDAISEIADALILPDESILVHTSGTVPMSILGYSSASYTGIFYPLQTFSKAREIAFEEVPILIEADDSGTLQHLKKLAKSLSPLVYPIQSKDRVAVHVAAVFASNFTNHLLRIAEEIMHRQGLDYEMLKPLVIEAIGKSLDLGAKKAQTGPAVRGDMETLESHLRFLNYNETFAKIYQEISQDIIDGQ